jgi:hypothetical protein
MPRPIPRAAPRTGSVAVPGTDAGDGVAVGDDVCVAGGEVRAVGIGLGLAVAGGGTDGEAGWPAQPARIDRPRNSVAIVRIIGDLARTRQPGLGNMTLRGVACYASIPVGVPTP